MKFVFLQKIPTIRRYCYRSDLFSSNSVQERWISLIDKRGNFSYILFSIRKLDEQTLIFVRPERLTFLLYKRDGISISNCDFPVGFDTKKTKSNTTFLKVSCVIFHLSYVTCVQIPSPTAPFIGANREPF